MEFKKIQSFTFLASLIGISILVLWMLRSYVYPVFWAAVIATLFYPWYERILQRTKQKAGVAAALTLILIILIFLIPAAVIVSIIVQQAFIIYDQFGNQSTINAITNAIHQVLEWPIINSVIGNDFDIQTSLTKWGQSISGFIYDMAASGGQNTAKGIIQFFIMLYTLYYFLRDGKIILRRLMHLLPLGDTYETALYKRFVSTARATLKGTLLIGCIQGTIGGIAFAIAGIPGAGFWGMIMIVLSIIPGIGGVVVLLPAAIIMLILGYTWQAVVIIVALLIASVIDNILRGPLVGKDAQMHPLLIFFATLGGLLSFGISGVVIGPVITALFLSLWGIYEQKYKTQLDKAD